MLNRTIAKFLFYGVAVTLLAWTASLTLSFLRMALPDAFFLVPVLGLVVFDVGMIAWLFVFLSHAQGAIQRSVAILLCLFDFAGVALMVLAEILLDGQRLVEAPAFLATTAVWGIAIWTVVNVGGVILFHLGDPTARREMALQSEKDAIFEGAIADLKNRRIQNQSLLANDMGSVLYDELLASIKSPGTGNTGKPIGDIYGNVTDPVLRQMIDDGRLPVQPPVPVPVKEPAPSKNGHGR